MNIPQWLKNLFAPVPVQTSQVPNHFTGLLPDTRTQEDKDKDYLHEEREVAKATDPFGNSKIVMSPYPYENQQGTSSCVAHGIGLAFAIFLSQVKGTYYRLGWLFNYRLRENYSGEGMVPVLAANSYRTIGAPLYASAPDVATEAEANRLVITDAMINEAKIFDAVEFYNMKTGLDVNTLANLAEQGHAIAVTIFATYAEWAKQYPEVQITNLTVADPRAVVNHEICVLPKSGFMENGTKYVSIQDSSLFGGFHIRHLSEDFVAKRVTTGIYWTEAKMLGDGPRPKFTFTRSLHVGDTGADVKALQTLLIAESLLPVDCVTGLFAGRTLAAVRAFQVKYQSDILIPQGLTEPTSTFGPGSIKKANALCA